MGRPKEDGREFAARLVEDQEYLASLRKRAIAGTLDPGVEELLLYYGFSAPQTLSETKSNLRLVQKGGEPSHEKN